MARGIASLLKMSDGSTILPNMVNAGARDGTFHRSGLNQWSAPVAHDLWGSACTPAVAWQKICQWPWIVPESCAEACWSIKIAYQWKCNQFRSTAAAANILTLLLLRCATPGKLAALLLTPDESILIMVEDAILHPSTFPNPWHGDLFVLQR